MTPPIKMRLANKGRGEFAADTSVIWLYDVIAADDDEAMWFGGVSPRQFQTALRATSGPVTLRLNSPGGSVFGAQAMVAAMREHDAPITARIDALAASAASVIAAEASAVEMATGAMLMIHKAWSVGIGNADDFLAMAALMEKIDRNISAAYARRGGDATDWMALMAAETWFTAEEAVAVGLADRVVAESAQRAVAAWDLSAFARAPAIESVEVGIAEAVTAPADDMRDRRRRQLAARLAACPI